MTYKNVYNKWRASPAEFWNEQAQQVDWITTSQNTFISNETGERWFNGGTLNTCFNCVDRHVLAGHGDMTAFIYDSPLTDTKCEISYAELQSRVEHVAACIADLGVTKGDRVIIYMPMILETAIAALACARLGAIHSIVFGGFAAPELATRIDDARPKLIMAASCGIEPNRTIAYKPLLDSAIELAIHKPDHCLIFQRPQAQATIVEGRDHDWAEAEAKACTDQRKIDCVAVEATDPLYILYTSGTTGIPKGVVRDNGGHLVALIWSMHNVYNIHRGDVFWSASDMGWVVGHSYILYGPLAIGATSIIYEGKPVGTPDAGAFWRVISEHKVKALFTAPTAFRAIKKEDPQATLLNNYDLSKLDALFLAGERADPDTINWAETNLQIPIIDNWWQTETGWPICANPLGLEYLPTKKGSPSVPMPGYELAILDDNNEPMPTNEIGSIVIKRPLPPGCLPSLWDNQDGFLASYMNDFPGYYKTGDAGFIDDDGYLFVMSRTDDIINIAGHRLSTGGMEEVLSGHPDIAECAVIGVRDELKGELPLGLVVLNNGVTRATEDILNECIQKVREEIGPVAAFKLIAQTPVLPKTRSGKILRGTIRKIANGEPWVVPATIDDPTVLKDVEQILQTVGYARNQNSVSA